MSSGLESASREDLLALIGLLQRQNEELAAANERLTARVSELERKHSEGCGRARCLTM
jgi:transposase